MKLTMLCCLGQVTASFLPVADCQCTLYVVAAPSKMDPSVQRSMQIMANLIEWRDSGQPTTSAYDVSL